MTRYGRCPVLIEYAGAAILVFVTCSLSLEGEGLSAATHILSENKNIDILTTHVLRNLRQRACTCSGAPAQTPLRPFPRACTSVGTGHHHHARRVAALLAVCSAAHSACVFCRVACSSTLQTQTHTHTHTHAYAHTPSDFRHLCICLQTYGHTYEIYTKQNSNTARRY
jgi:hypothetical protein